MENTSKKPEITEEDLDRVVKLVAVEVLREQRDEIIRRAHMKLREQVNGEERKD